MSTNVVWHDGPFSRAERWDRLGVAGATVWLTGLSGSGKSTVANEAWRLLLDQGVVSYVLDGDNLRHGLNANLGFGRDDRSENVRRVGEVAKLFTDQGALVLVPLISPYRDDRDRVRASHHHEGLTFLEVFVDTPLDECERRDPKGLYARARAGQVSNMTGVDDPYEPPLAPDLVLTPADGDAVTQARRLLELVADRLAHPKLRSRSR